MYWNFLFTKITQNFSMKMLKATWYIVLGMTNMGNVKGKKIGFLIRGIYSGHTEKLPPSLSKFFPVFFWNFITQTGFFKFFRFFKSSFKYFPVFQFGQKGGDGQNIYPCFWFMCVNLTLIWRFGSGSEVRFGNRLKSTRILYVTNWILSRNCSLWVIECKPCEEYYLLLFLVSFPVNHL